MPQTIRLSTAAQKQAHALGVLVEHYAGMHAQIRESLQQLIEDETGVDLTASVWDLNTETGELTSKDEPATEPEQLPATV